MPDAVQYSYFSVARPAVIVVSHERSGTHFLMNSIAACYGYVSIPWVNFDHPQKNFLELYKPEGICKILLELAQRPLANVVKSHHTADYFKGQLLKLTEKYVFLYIHRNPVEVMLSYWRFMHNFAPSANEGPRLEDPVRFASATPTGHMLRYQSRPAATILDRWANHVTSWMEVADSSPNIRFLRYEELNNHFEPTIRSLSGLLGQAPNAFTRPSKEKNVIRRGPADPAGQGVPPDVEALRRYCRENAGRLMERLGY